MAIRGVIFDVSDTIINTAGDAVSGILPALERLRALNVQIIAASTHEVAEDLRQAGISYDLLVTKSMVPQHKAKGSPVWIEYIKRHTGLATNQLIYVGDTKQDMVTAASRNMVYFHASWAARYGIYGQYGIPAPSPGWLAAVVEHIFTKKTPWWWQLDAIDDYGYPVKARTMIAAGRPLGEDIYDKLIEAFKRGAKAMVGTISMRDFTMLHLIASLYAEGLTEETDLWTTYPSSKGSPNLIMGELLSYGSKLFHRKYHGELFQRHSPTINSRYARERGGIPLGVQNQLDSVNINPEHRQNLSGKRVLVFDDNLTWGPTIESARNMLIAGGAARVISVGIGKFGPGFNVIGIRPKAGSLWDPFSSAPQYENIELQYQKYVGDTNDEAQDQFIASYEAMKAARWT
jgi:hypothetical protein